MNNVECLTVRMSSDALPAWNFILQKGFFLRAHSGMTVRQFLVEVLGYENAFIDETVRTIFLNSSPVDDISAVHLKDGDRVAIGGAMPGLVGIVMGRDNPYKEFRSGIACAGNDAELIPENEIRIFTKIFSTIVTKTGVDVLARGIEMEGAVLQALLQENEAHLLNEGGLGEFAIDQDRDVRVVVKLA